MTGQTSANPKQTHVSTGEICPCCGAKNRPGEPGGQLRFCIECRFPLLLIAGKYRLVRELSEGGCGKVYEAHHTHLTREPCRAIKIIKPEMMKREGMKARFSREVQVTGALSQRNRHIVRIYDDFGEEPELGFFYVMEFLQGQSIDALLREHSGALPFALGFSIFSQLCDAMQDAHAEQIIHRDLKPENLFVISKRREPHFLKVIDFGIAKPLNNLQATQLTQYALGTPLYMSPEQCTNSPVDERSDIYSMGCILFELLTGFAPFSPQTLGSREVSVLEIIACHLSKPPPNPNQYLPPSKQVSTELSNMLTKAMAKKPAQRFASVEELELAFMRAKEAELGELATGPSLSTMRSNAPAHKTHTRLPDVAVTHSSSPLAVPNEASVGEVLVKTFNSRVDLIEQVNSVAELSNTSERIIQTSRWPWLTAIVLITVGVLAASFWWFNDITASPGNSRPRGVAGTRPNPMTTKAVPTLQLPTLAHLPRRAQVTLRKPKGVALKRVKHRPRQLVSPLKHKRPRHRPERRRKRPRKSRVPRPKGRPVQHCPSWAGSYWLRLKMSPRQMRELKRHSFGPLRLIRFPWGFCVGTKDKSAALELRAQGLYHPCRFTVWGQPKREYRLHMTPEEEPAPDPAKITNNCLR